MKNIIFIYILKSQRYNFTIWLQIEPVLISVRYSSVKWKKIRVNWFVIALMSLFRIFCCFFYYRINVTHLRDLRLHDIQIINQWTEDGFKIFQFEGFFSFSLDKLLIFVHQLPFFLLVSIIQTYRPWTPRRFDGKSRSLDDRDYFFVA